MVWLATSICISQVARYKNISTKAVYENINRGSITNVMLYDDKYKVLYLLDIFFKTSTTLFDKAQIMMMFIPV